MLKAEIGNTTVYYTRGFELISRREKTIASYYVYDGGLSVRALTNESGTVTNTLVTDRPELQITLIASRAKNRTLQVFIT